MKEKVVLAYSGGLDTTAIIPWLKETYNYNVVCVCIDCGQAEELTVWKKEPRPAALPSCILKMLSMNFVMIILFPVSRLMPYTRTSTC